MLMLKNTRFVWPFCLFNLSRIFCNDVCLCPFYTKELVCLIVFLCILLVGQELLKEFGRGSCLFIIPNRLFTLYTLILFVCVCWRRLVCVWAVYWSEEACCESGVGLLQINQF